ncbi:uncharacterized protein LOC122074460 [Macadamia integrifolia]|uniref:uncharacterized protein LOC122074460 n=1 Tax=Macadamia integrifolia TaxID=60698 RepID=UPI001C4E7F2A|nr:uncharacterized protein LOC122074460 [Macadamia integrifolia]XP_042495206.1 uncharacterized protein LOC122074460 [Macadamia integrifolia]XP_042495207.1 uncharacterized protein LOC122074460 [Macadamia integrifolia]
MAASANPSGNQEGSHVPSSYNGVTGGGNPSNGNSGAVVENSGLVHTLKHDPGLSTDWTAEEQSILDEGLAKYASESIIVRYAKIAMQLQDKTVRDVALRLKWMTKKESGKRRKEDHNLTRKNKDKKEKVTDPSARSSSHLGSRPNVPPYALPMIPVDNDDGISYEAIGGATGQMLEQNAQAFNQISANLSTYQIRENVNLFCQARDNILTILKDLNDMPGVMNQMPPLPVKVNEELANSILPRTTLPMQS